MSLMPGMTGHADTTVVESNTARAVGSGLVPVYATPYMIALMENAAVNAVLPHLAEGEGTVGTHLDVSHEAATPIGLKVWADAELMQVNGKELIFKVSAHDKFGCIGKGTHKRYIINVDRFMAKTWKKLEE